MTGLRRFKQLISGSRPLETHCYMAVIRAWFKCFKCKCSWFSDTDDGQECPECGSMNWEIFDEEDVSDFYGQEK